jgi:hypothetical protein
MDFSESCITAKESKSPHFSGFPYIDKQKSQICKSYSLWFMKRIHLRIKLILNMISEICDDLNLPFSPNGFESSILVRKMNP